MPRIIILTPFLHILNDKDQIVFVQYAKQMYIYITRYDDYLADDHTELWHQLGATSLAARHTDATTVHTDTPIHIVWALHLPFSASVTTKYELYATVITEEKSGFKCFVLCMEL